MKKTLNRDTPVGKVQEFISKEASRLRALDATSLAKEYVQLDPPVITKYYAPTFFRNSMASIIFTTEENPTILAKLRNHAEEKSVNELRMELYKGSIYDLLVMYYPTDYQFSFPDADNFDDLYAATTEILKESFIEIARFEMEKMGKTIGIMNGLGIIPLSALESKDWSWGGINDFDWGRGIDQAPLAFPDQETKAYSVDALTKEKMQLQWHLVLENIQYIAKMLGIDAQQMIRQFIRSRNDSMNLVLQSTSEDLGVSAEFSQHIPLFVEKIRSFDKAV